MPRSNFKPHKCSECQGTPGQHNIRDATITVTVTATNVKTYPQHSFKFAG